ncbi:MAG: peptide ABC transporter substrate-binding protein, partial [Methanobacteriota archaeon]
QALLSAIPIPDPETRRKRIILSGEIPSPTRLPVGCPFYSRCPRRLERCQSEPPPAVTLAEGHISACWLHVNQN